MSVQDSFQARPDITRPGMEYDCAFTDVITGVAGEAFGFGLYVVQKDGGWFLPASAADVTDFEGGVTLVDNAALPTGQGYVEGDAVRVMRSGRVGVDAEDGMVRGGSVYVRQATGTSTVLGQFAGAVDSTFNTQMTAFRVYQTPAGSPVPVIIEINPPGASA